MLSLSASSVSIQLPAFAALNPAHSDYALSQGGKRLTSQTERFCSVLTRLAASRYKPAVFQWLVEGEMNGSVFDSTDMVINRRAKMSVGITRDGSCSLTGSGMTFAILTIQEVEMRTSAK